VNPEVDALQVRRTLLLSPFFCLLFAGAAEVGARKEGSRRATPGKRVRRDKRNRATGERKNDKTRLPGRTRP
jgi:hypothetical protein